MRDLEIWPRDGIHDLPEDRTRLTIESMASLRAQWAQTRNSLAGSPALETFTAQLEREWAIETGQIENLYDIERGVTQTLIEEGFRASVLERGSTNKPPEYVLSLINDQRDALEGLFAFVRQDRPLSTSYIKELHAAMTRSQPVTEAFDTLGNRIEVPLLRGEWKTAPNYPLRNGRRFLYCPPEQTASEMERLVAMHATHGDAPPEARAAWLHHRFTQIHPFQDGNGRVARALASLALIQSGMLPMVVPREEKDSYLDALEAADGGNLRPFVLSIARLQQREMDKANRIIFREAPSSTNLSEAVGSLVNALGLSHKDKDARRLDALKKVWSSLSLSLQACRNEVLREFKNQEMSSYFINESFEQEFPEQDPLLKNLPLRIPELDIDFKPDVVFRFATSLLELRLDIALAAPANDLDERVVAVAFRGRNSEISRLKTLPFVTNYRIEDFVLSSQAKVWAQRVFIDWLDEIRKVS